MSKPLKVIAGAPDRPLVIGDIEIPCYVLEDETRVLSQRGVFSSVNATRGGPRGQSELGAEMPRFASQNWLKPFISDELSMALKSPIVFSTGGGPTAHGYPATSLVDLCNAIMEAEKHGSTTPRQQIIVERATTLIRGFATVGIIALIDEATGYQRIREEQALATILERFIAKDLQPWTRTFPYEFYQLIYKLRGWPGPFGHKRTPQIGKDTNDVVYERLAPGVLDELRRVNPVQASGSRRARHHQWFTRDIGHPQLKDHLIGVMALMRAAPNWTAFKRMLQRAYPKLNETIPLALDED
ncbi:MAG: P63C domain-containing protein [Gammaproteobacteria bacterium]|nr:P63C domain-containing protein [Gammaproteobacteria bacterium]